VLYTGTMSEIPGGKAVQEPSGRTVRLLSVVSLLVPILAAAPPARAAAAELILSEYVEGSSNNKAIEIYNPTPAAIDLAAESYELRFYFNANTTAETIIPLSGTVASGDVFVVADEDATQAILDAADQISGQNFFNGNDAAVLRKGPAVIDSFGRVGEDPGSQWSGNGVGTRDQTLRRKADVCAGDRDPSDDFDPSEEWDEYPQNTFSGLGAHSDTCAPQPPSTEIFDVQGSGTASPFDGQTVTLRNNVVTAVGPEGFFIQTPEARDDHDPDTSNGLYVYTGSAPSVSAGDLVDVTGEVDEFFDFTEITGAATVTVVGTHPLPPAVVFDATTPSPDPEDPGCALEPECYEGMRISVPQGTVSAPNLSFSGDPIAELAVVAGPTRAFREPGIAYPGLGGTLPTWDGNPEIFELDPDRLGLPNRSAASGSVFTAAGVLGFEFGDYELWPTELDLTPATLPRPVRPRADGELTVGSLNLFQLFDHVDDPGSDDEVVGEEEYAQRLAKLSRSIREVLGTPDVLAVQEVENLAVLEDLADRIRDDDGKNGAYSAHLIEGNDIGGIDVGFLVSERVRVDAVTQFGAGELFPDDGSLLHDRPPLLLEATFLGDGGDFPFAVMVNHTRSRIGIEDADGRVRRKRLEQAQSIAEKVQTFQTQHPATALVVLGDFNAFSFTDGYVDVVGQIAGDVDPAENLLSGPDLVAPNLTNEVLRLGAGERYSYIYEGSAQLLDHALTSQAAAPWVSGFAFGRGNADAPRHWLDDATTALRASDHDGFVLYLAPGAPPCDGLLLNRDRFCVEVAWRDFQGNTGAGRVVPFGSDDSGLFWFFAPDNWEMLVKVLDGCGVNDRYWVFAAATTNVEYTLRVTDTANGVLEEYFNPLGTASPAITDTGAFATCP